MISALPEFAVELGAPRVVRGVRIEHVCGDPRLPAEHDLRLRYELMVTALRALASPISQPTMSGPLAGVSLGLPTVHILEDEIKNQVEPSTYQREIGLLELAIDAEAIKNAMQRLRGAS